MLYFLQYNLHFSWFSLVRLSAFQSLLSLLPRVASYLLGGRDKDSPSIAGHEVMPVAQPLTCRQQATPLQVDFHEAERSHR